uniref:tRNA nucleotidyltransferase cca2-like isoform X2 n=1 Tax=Erigeron canadensis TaxID=72917 RepID=UPI001CB9B1B3|nr:tRNA nucleotidyltransferase cca2-like isoform X2 [Erigeron canadensis]XP_043609599.1 tRNA nucleotidyltransferase cca2-like isoform X2 [Erigeron canadensis]XP_043609600.1 tRNA nucleotidyltransferase cca2-like isoform X2 [Erigeron canadensis]
MARISTKITQLRWFYGSSLTGKSLVPFRKSVIELKNMLFHFPRTHRCSRAMSMTVMVKENIDLTEKEKQIFDGLLQVVYHFKLETKVRVAGGWVRDKLLGKECYDIDIALDDMLGREFCEKVNEYLVSTGEEETQGIGVIQSNPDQSKHLETARMRLFDVWIDFVNLRSEDYADNSRIPTMQFGTAEQDAFRRDLTINSLFYNINTCSVEDLTGRGLDDLRSARVVTPLPPKETFLDDPFRVLRAIRFSARFEFEMAEDLKFAAADNEVKSAIADKISRERIGHEVDLMVSGNQPVKAMAHISELGLLWVVFTPPPNCEPIITDDHDKVCVGFMDVAWGHMLEVGCTFSDEQRRLYLYASLFVPLWKTVYTDNKKKKVPIVNYIFRNSLKLKASDADDVMRLHTAVEKFLSLIPFVLSSEDLQNAEVDWEKEIIDVPPSLKLRILLGLLVKEIKDFWRAALMLSTLLYQDSFSVEVIVGELEKRREVFKEVEQEILKLGLDKVWEVKPLINGKDIIRLLELQKGGPVVSEWQRKLLQWQLAYPSGSVDECVDWMTRQTQLKRSGGQVNHQEHCSGGQVNP